MKLLLWIACAVCAQSPTDGVLELRLEGPLSAVHIDGVRTAARVVSDLSRGEAVTVRVPWLPVDSSKEPKLGLVEGGGEAHIEALHPAPEVAPKALTRRAIPRPIKSPARLAPVAWWLFAAGLLAVFATRKRPLAALFVGGTFGALLAALPTAHPSASNVAVLEVGPFGAWWVHVGSGELEPLAGAQLELEPEPEGSEWEWVVDVTNPAHQRRLARSLSGEETLLIARSQGPAEVSLEVDRNGLQAFAEVWRRGERGELICHGPWALGAPLSEACPGPTAPNWLWEGAPPGAQVWLGRLAEPPPGVDVAWVRAIWPPER